VWPPPPLPPTPMAGLDLSSRFELSQMQVYSADGRGGGSGVWPPPPLPPVSCDITARIEALERQRNMSYDALRDKDMEYDATVGELRAKVELLEAKLRAEESSAARMADEVQNISETLRQTYQEENDRLRTELRQAEFRINELRMELENERSGLRRQSTASTMSIEDLSRQLEAMTRERDAFSADSVHLKKANTQREQESSTLRVMLSEERKHMKLLQTERDTARADLDATKARSRLDRDGQMLRESGRESVTSGISLTGQRQSFSGMAPQSFSGRNQEPTFSVDLTAGQDDLQTSSFTRSFREQVEVDLDSTDS